METKRIKFLLAFLFSLAIGEAFSQRILLEYDSLPVSKPKVIRNTYELSPTTHAITLVGKKPKPVAKIPNNFWGNFTGGVLTLLSGVSTTSSAEGMWWSENELIAKHAEYTLNVHLFFQGELLKSRERVKNDDGSSSVVTEKGLQVDWREGAGGLIFEKSDTVGRFAVITNLQSDIESLNWLSRIEEESIEIRSKLNKYTPFHMYHDFKVNGLFYGRNFSILTSSRNFRALLFIENVPVAVFQGDPNFIMLGRKNKIDPYLLLNKAARDPDEVDLFRLAMLGRLLSNLTSVDFYEM